MSDYPALSNFIESCLHQDADLIGNSLDEIIAYYIGASSADHLAQLKKDMSDFSNQHAARMEAAFDELYGFDFDPKLWDSSVKDFFERVQVSANVAMKSN